MTDHTDRWQPYFILDADGEPVPVEDVREWGAWYETAERVVLQSAVDRRGAVLERPLRGRRSGRGRGAVSTVFLALDHAWQGGPPVLWETMIFGGPLDGEQWRYRSKLDALRGHAAAVAVLQALGRRLPRRTKLAWSKRIGLTSARPRRREARRVARLEARLARAWQAEAAL